MEYGCGNTKFDLRVEELHDQITQEFDYIQKYNISDDEKHTVIVDIVHAIANAEWELTVKD